jgi:PhnB protein
MAVHPYLFFGGNCREAFTRYQEVFGGQLDMMTLSEMPDDEPAPDADPDLIMHAALMFGEDVLMGSDDPSDDFGPVHGMFVNYSVAGIDEAERVFAALADGGEIRMPLGETFWAPRFGMCVDRFGTPWMVNAEPPDGS